jgi:hypothetical protein
MRDAEACLRKFADMLRDGVPEDEVGPLIWLLGRSMSRQAKRKKP